MFLININLFLFNYKKRQFNGWKVVQFRYRSSITSFLINKDFPDKLSYFFMYLGFDFQFYK